MTEQLVQGSDEWKAARCGSLGASRIADVVARTKSGWGASRGNVLAELVCERLTGVPSEGFTNAAMQWGNEQEPHARDLYKFLTDMDVIEVGLFRHPTIAGTHASPDGAAGDCGLIEIKCPLSKTHIDTLLGSSIDGKYIKQMQWQMAVTGKEWCDFVSYDPRLPTEMQIFIKRVMRDDDMIAELEKDVSAFLQEVDETVAKLRKRYQPISEAAE